MVEEAHQLCASRYHGGTFDGSLTDVNMQDPFEAAQLEMQQKLGRCMLRFQQYERMLKTMVATASFEGAPENLTSVLAKQTTEASTMTLGTLVRLFARDCLVDGQQGVDATEAAAGSDEKTAEVSSMKMQFAISMPTERYEQTSAALKELKEMRNDLVHHLIERFDIAEESGCLAATRHLQDCYQKIDDHLGQLKEWSDGQANVRQLAASFMQSTEFENAFVHGINPDGTVCWERSTIVECLRDAENACCVKGWTSLDAAIAFITREHRDQTLALYGCKTWRQVLMKSRQFELRNEAGSEASRGQTWYRSLAGSSNIS